MLSLKRRGRHSTLGSLYYWTLTVLVVSAMASMRWPELSLFILGAALAQLGKATHQRHGPVIRVDADSVLRRQRQEPAAVARASAVGVLGAADRTGATDRLARATAPPAGRTRGALGRPIRHHGLATCGRQQEGDEPAQREHRRRAPQAGRHAAPLVEQARQQRADEAPTALAA